MAGPRKPKNVATTPVQMNSHQLKTERMEEALLSFVHRYKGEWFEEETFNRPEIHWVSEFPPNIIFRIDAYETAGDDEDDPEYIYVWWDGREFSYYEEPEEAFNDLIVSQREKSIRSQTWFYSSPLIISGVIATIMMLIIGFQVVRGVEVPTQLWSIFTAVAAFYFGKEGVNAIRQRDQAGN